MKKWLLLLTIALISTLPGLALANGKNKQSPHGGSNAPYQPQLIGTVTNLQSAASGSTFTLYGDSKHTLNVVTTSTTTITNQSDNSAASLGNGLIVAVKGTQNTSTGEVTATAILVCSSVVGTVSNLQIVSTGDTFTLTTAGSQTMNIVMTSATTVKNYSNGSATTLSEGQQVQVTGKYDASAQTFTTTSIVVNDKKPVARWVGKVANLQTTSDGSTFTLQGKGGSTLSVATTSTTKITKFSDNSDTTLANGQMVNVSGAYDDTTKVLTATSVVVQDNKPQDNKQRLTGTITSINATSGTVVVTVTDTCLQVTSTSVTIATTSSTAYKTGNGKTAAFSDLKVGATVHAEGTFDATTQTLTATGIYIGK